MTTQQITRTIAQEMLDEANEHPHGFIVRVAGQEVAIDRVELRGRLYIGHGIDDDGDAFTLVLWAPKTAGYGSRSPRIRHGARVDLSSTGLLYQQYHLITDMGCEIIYGTPAHMVRIVARYREENARSILVDKYYHGATRHADELTDAHLLGTH